MFGSRGIANDDQDEEESRHARLYEQTTQLQCLNITQQQLLEEILTKIHVIANVIPYFVLQSRAHVRHSTVNMKHIKRMEMK